VDQANLSAFDYSQKAQDGVFGAAANGGRSQNVESTRAQGSHASWWRHLMICITHTSWMRRSGKYELQWKCSSNSLNDMDWVSMSIGMITDLVSAQGKLYSLINLVNIF
jgi:hypothetical protein